MPAQPVLDHDRFLAACARHEIEASCAEELWSDLSAAVAPPAGRPRGLPRAAIAAVIAGSLLLSGAGIWWTTLISRSAGTIGVLAFAAGWVAVYATLAEYTHRRRAAYVDAAFGVVAVAYVPLVIGAAEDLLLGPVFNHWWGRLPIELGLLAAATVAARRFLRPILTMLPVTVAAGALAADALVSSVDGWDKDITLWPGWSAFVAVGIATLATAAAVSLDRRGLRETGFWPSLLADSWTIGALLGVSASLDTGASGAGIAVAIAGSIGTVVRSSPRLGFRVLPDVPVGATMRSWGRIERAVQARRSFRGIPRQQPGRSPNDRGDSRLGRRLDASATS